MLSPDGHCRAFDADGAGARCSATASAMVVLKRLADALADGDTIHAVIRGSAINNDGASKVGYTAPSVAGQAAVIARGACRCAGVDPADASATSRRTAPARARRSDRDRGADAGLPAPRPRAASARSARSRPTSATSTRRRRRRADQDGAGARAWRAAAEPALRDARTRDRFRRQPVLRQHRADGRGRRNGAPRRAGVSSFGIGGTNAHVVLEEAPARAGAGPSRPWQLLLAVGADAPRRSRPRRPVWRDTCSSTTPHRRWPTSPTRCRSAAAPSPIAAWWSSRRGIWRRAAAGVTPPDASPATRNAARARPVAFLFRGQGAQYVGMARELYAAEPALPRRRRRAACAAARCRISAGTCVAIVLTRSADAGRCRRALSATARARSRALFVVEYALAQLWMRWGVRPAALLGHSIGEYVAACLAGVFSLDDALRLVAGARPADAGPALPGAMLAVPCPEPSGDAAARRASGLAAVNGRQLSVVAGPIAAIDALEARLTAPGMAGAPAATTSHAFHSPLLMRPVAGRASRRAGATSSAHAPQMPFVSNVTGTWITAAEATDPDYWARHLRAAGAVCRRRAARCCRPRHACSSKSARARRCASLVRQQPVRSGAHGPRCSPRCRRAADDGAGSRRRPATVAGAAVGGRVCRSTGAAFYARRAPPPGAAADLSVRAPALLDRARANPAA